MSNYQNLISYETILLLKKQVLAWIFLGLIIMSIFFYIAKGMIVFIGGISLGLYLYNKYGKYDQSFNGLNIQGVSEQVFSNAVNMVKNGINMFPNENIEKFQNFNGKLFNNMWYKN